MALEEVRHFLDELTARIPACAEGDSWIDALPEVQRLCRSGEASGLKAALRAWPGSVEFDGRRRHFGRSAHSLDVDGLAEWLLLRSTETGTSTACADLLKYSEERDYPAVFTLLLAGLQIYQPVALGADVRLLPFAPEFFRELGYFDADAVAFDQTREGMREISCAAVIHVRHPKILTAIGDPPEVNRRALALDTRIYGRLNAARLMCGLLEPRDISIAGQRAQVLMSVPCPLRASYGGNVMTGHSIAYGYVREQFGDSASSLYEAFSNLPSALKQKLLIPLERLQSAIHEQHRYVDSAIDLGIALESLFLTDDDTTELSYRIAVRAARLLDTDLRERVSNRRLFKAVYALRSKVVHRGKCDVKPSAMAGRANTQELLRDGIKATARAARAIIERGVVDWAAFDLT